LVIPIGIKHRPDGAMFCAAFDAGGGSVSPKGMTCWRATGTFI